MERTGWVLRGPHAVLHVYFYLSITTWYGGRAVQNYSGVWSLLFLGIVERQLNRLMQRHYDDHFYELYKTERSQEEEQLAESEFFEREPRPIYVAEDFDHNEERLKDYLDGIAEEFEEIYEGDPVLPHLLDGLWYHKDLLLFLRSARKEWTEPRPEYANQVKFRLSSFESVDDVKQMIILLERGRNIVHHYGVFFNDIFWHLRFREPENYKPYVIKFLNLLSKDALAFNLRLLLDAWPDMEFDVFLDLYLERLE